MLCSRRPKLQDLRPEQKWDFISLQDFKSTSCITPLAYGYLWASLAVSCAVYGVDTFTAVNLLAFNKFTSIEPKVPLSISKWIFSVCIILSWVNLGYEHWRAWRVIRRGAVSESYLDSLAVRLQCIRVGKKCQGWRRFLVFAELTKSKKGAEYVALFTYFAFQSWIRVIFCSGPRQVVNALTLYSVYQVNLDPKSTDAATSILQFFKNIGILADENYQQALILAGMLFTLVIWVFAALSLILAILFYVLFLWHYIPNSDGGLSSFCERKINHRLQRIVSAKVNKALEDEERRLQKAERKAIKNGEKPVLGRQATLPTLFDNKDDDRLPSLPMLNGNETTTTLPLYSSRPATPADQQPSLPGLELSNLDQRRPYPSRLGSTSSALSSESYGPNASLLGSAAGMGYSGRSASPAPSLPPLDTAGSAPFPQPQRTMTAGSQGSQWQRGAPQPMSNGPMGPPLRSLTHSSIASGNGPVGPRGPMSRQPTQDSYVSSPMSYTDPSNQISGPTRSGSVDNYGRPMPPPANSYNDRSTPSVDSMGRRTPYGEMGPPNRRPIPPGSDNGSIRQGMQGPGSGPRSPPYNGPPAPPENGNGYMPYNNNNSAPPSRSTSAGFQGPGNPRQPPYRNMTEPISNRPPPPNDYFSNGPARQGTPMSMRQGRQGSGGSSYPAAQPQYQAYPGPGAPSGPPMGSGPPRSGSPATFNGRPTMDPQGRW